MSDLGTVPRQTVLNAVCVVLSIVSVFKRGQGTHTLIIRQPGGRFVVSSSPDNVADLRRSVLKVCAVKWAGHECACRGYPNRRYFPLECQVEVIVYEMADGRVVGEVFRRHLTFHYFAAPYTVSQVVKSQEDDARLLEVMRRLVKYESSRLKKEKVKAFCYSVVVNSRVMGDGSRLVEVRPVCIDVEEVESLLHDFLSQFRPSNYLLFAYRRGKFCRASRSSVHHLLRKFASSGCWISQLCKGVYLCYPEDKCSTLIEKLTEKQVEVFSVPVVEIVDEDELFDYPKSGVIVYSTGTCSGTVKERARRIVEELGLSMISDGVYMCTDVKCVKAIRKLREAGVVARLFRIVEEEPMAETTVPIHECPRARLLLPDLVPMREFDWIRSFSLPLVRLIEDESGGDQGTHPETRVQWHDA